MDLRVVCKSNEYTGEEASRFAESKSYSINSVGDSLLLKLRSGRIQIEWQSNGGFSIMVGLILFQMILESIQWWLFIMVMKG